jgi:hypothetical protein
MGLISLMTLVIAAGSATIPGNLTCDLNGLRQPCSELSAPALTVILISFAGGLALALTGLYRLARLFGNYARGEIFTRDSVREIRLLGYVAVAYAVFQLVLFIGTLALTAAVGVELPTELRGDLPIGPVVVASFILLLSWVMDVGAELREENELTV